MLKREDLMIGSWVKIPELEYYNSEDDFDNGYTQVKSLGTYDLDTYSLKEISYEEIEPIPLTDAIIDKIGLGKDNENGIEFRYFLGTDYPAYIKLSNGFEYCFPTPKYVHELQMALVVCKFNINIEL
jgi:hypothetical protein